MTNKNNNIEWIKDDTIGILKLNPEASGPQNYLTDPEFIKLETLQENLSDGIKGLIITGTGRHFSAGADPESIFKQIENKEEFKHSLIKGNKLLNFIENLEIPTIAAISGVCFGGGLEIALSCHIRVCSEKSLFAFPEVNQNLIPGMGGIRKLEKLAGKAKALELVVSGDIINANKAYELKLVDYITGKKKALEFSLELLKNITKDRPLKIINTIMRSINNSSRMEIDEAIEKDAEMFCELAIEEAKKKKS